MAKEKTIYDLVLHEILFFNESCLSVTRVPGGWVYCCWDDTGRSHAAVFVEYNEEFLIGGKNG